MNITNLTHKIKKFNKLIEDNINKEIGTVLMIVLVGFVSFGLGRLSSKENNKQSITIKYPINFSQNKENKASIGDSGEVKPLFESSISKSGLLVASKKGTKYHYPWCSGAKRIKETNKIYFDSIKKAREKGYTPAGNCKGLK